MGSRNPKTARSQAVSLVLSVGILIAGLSIAFTKGMEANRLAHELNSQVERLDQLEEQEDAFRNAQKGNRR
jgi:hypothetical protein